MKKTLFIAIACVFALAGCTKFEKDPEFQKIQTGAPKIVKTSFTTTSITASVVPADGKTQSYSFAVLEGTADPSIAPASILNASIETAIDASCELAAECDTIKVEIDGLSEGETYTLYAVAASETGTLSEVATKIFILDDDVVPSFEPENVVTQLSEEDSSVVVTIPFNRDIKLGENAKVKISEWGKFDSSNLVPIPGVGELIGSPLSTFELTAADGNVIAVENVLTVNIPGSVYVPGKILSVTYEAGTVISLPVSEGAQADIPCDAYSDEYVFYNSGPYEGLGVFVEYPSTTFELGESSKNPTFVIAELWESAEFKIGGETKIVSMDEVLGEAIYEVDDPKCSSLRKSPIGEGTFQLNATGDSLSIVFPVAPVAGEDFHLEIAEGALNDIYGNANAALSTKIIGIGSLDFQFTPDVTGNTVDCIVKPAINGVYYYTNILPDASSVSDAEIISSVKEEIQYWAEYDEVSFEEEYLAYFASSGEEQTSRINCKSETVYTVFAFFMNPDGTVISDVYRHQCTTTLFARPTATTGSYYMTEDSILGERYTEGCPVTWKDGISPSDPDTLVIGKCGYKENIEYKFLVDESGNAVLLPVAFGASLGQGPIYLAEAINVAPQYAEFQSYISEKENTLYVGCLYYDTRLLNNAPEYFSFDSAAPAAKHYVRKDAVKQTSSLKTTSPVRVHKRKK